MALSIHLGAHKTASTHLQVSLRQVRDQMAAAGLCYVDPAHLRTKPLMLTQMLADGPGCAGEDDFIAAFQALRGGAPDLLVSEENILGGTHRSNCVSRKGVFHPFAVRRLRHLLALTGEEECTLYLALRDPAGFNTSAFALQVSAGNEVEFSAWLRGRDPAHLGWLSLVRRLVAMKDVRHLVIWRYEDYGALRPQLLARMLPDGVAAQVPDLPPANESMTQTGFDWFVDRAMRDSEIDLRKLAMAARLKFRRADGHAPLRLVSDADQLRSAREYADDVAAISGLPKVEFLRP